jgi:hypothetical protein
MILLLKKKIKKFPPIFTKKFSNDKQLAFILSPKKKINFFLFYYFLLNNKFYINFLNKQNLKPLFIFF